jgi:hypothetical protein
MSSFLEKLPLEILRLVIEKSADKNHCRSYIFEKCLILSKTLRNKLYSNKYIVKLLIYSSSSGTIIPNNTIEKLCIQGYTNTMNLVRYHYPKTTFKFHHLELSIKNGRLGTARFLHQQLHLQQNNIFRIYNNILPESIRKCNRTGLYTLLQLGYNMDNNDEMILFFQKHTITFDNPEICNLYYACYFGNVSSIKFYLNMSKKCKLDNNCIMLSICSNKMKCLKFLLQTTKLKQCNIEKVLKLCFESSICTFQCITILHSKYNLTEYKKLLNDYIVHYSKLLLLPWYMQTFKSNGLSLLYKSLKLENLECITWFAKRNYQLPFGITIDTLSSICSSYMINLLLIRVQLAKNVLDNIIKYAIKNMDKLLFLTLIKSRYSNEFKEYLEETDNSHLTYDVLCQTQFRIL